MRDLHALVDCSNARFGERYSQALLDRMMHVGDPLADAAVAALHERRYDRGADKLAAVRALAADGEPAARAFVEAVATDPVWLDRRALESGRALALGFHGLMRLSLLHSLFAGGVFARATLVTTATGRLGADPASRIRETGAFIAAILQPGGLERGAIGHDTTLRVRLLHSSIRAWLARTPGFADEYVGAPIDQTMLAMTLGLFSYLNLRSFVRLGASFSDGEAEAHQHLWRYVGWLLGIEDALLARSLRQEADLWRALVAHQAFPADWGPRLLEESVRAAARLSGKEKELRPFFRSLFLHLSGPGWFGLDERPSLDPRLRALRVATAAASLRRRWTPGGAAAMAGKGLAAFERAAALARVHPYAVRIETPADDARAQAAHKALARAVRDRFAGGRAA